MRRAHRQARGTIGTLDAVHVEEALRLAKWPLGKEAALPGGVQMEVRHGKLVFHPPGGGPHVPPLEGERH